MNRLQHETSPYLLQHAGNPVDWYAWKPEALARARAENKPILVSIGYSTCHWCHVMEHESFENEDIAAFMNDNFVCIKVDREERPDVDAIYMEACQILNGSGGWPLNCFLTPDGRPFYAGTYFPPRPAHNRPSWLQVLQHMSRVWESERDKVFEQAERITARIRGNDEVFVQNIGPEFAGEEAFPADLPDTIFARMRDSFDRAEGGFGGAPKFPSTMAIQYLLNYHWFRRQPEALEQALLSLDKMIQGGIYDQIGGGFARYSTDREWLAPHFEKMLYDNALLVCVLAEAYKLTKKDLYRETIEETLEYIRRDMTHAEGGFYSAEDADSEGQEGKFYVWDKAEIEQLLGEDAALFCDFYDVREGGNWEHVSILRRLQSYEEYARLNDLDLAVLKQRLRAGRERLFAHRAQRIRPGLDDKILLGWNALMASAYAAAFTALGREEYRAAALRSLDFCLEKFAQPDGEALFHTWKNGQAQYDAFLDDYAFFIAALLDGYQISFDPRYLQRAGKYADYVLSYFSDPASPMLFFTAENQTDIVLRKKDLYDSATPSGNSTMAHNLQRLGILLDRREWRDKARQMLLAIRDTLARYPLSFERWAGAVLNEVHPYHEIAVVGDNAFEKAVQLQTVFVPNKVVAASRGENGSVPLLAGKTGEGDALIYICRDFACQRPIRTFDEFYTAVRPE